MNADACWKYKDCAEYWAVGTLQALIMAKFN
jgi:hypothetical protein